MVRSPRRPSRIVAVAAAFALTAAAVVFGTVAAAQADPLEPVPTTTTVTTPTAINTVDDVVLQVAVVDANEMPGAGVVRVLAGTLPIGGDYPLVDGAVEITVGGEGSPLHFAPGVWEFSAEFVPADPVLQAPSTSIPVSVTVAPAASSVELFAPEVVTAGSSTTLTALVSTVIPDAAVYGVVSFYANGALVGTADVVNDLASVSWTPAEAGAVSLYAVYSGDRTFALATSAQLAVTVAPAAAVPAMTPAAPRLADTGTPALPLAATGALALLALGLGLGLAARRRTGDSNPA